jgi:hypothetical protein
MLCTLRSRRLCERAPSRGVSAAAGGSTATSVTTPATRLGAAIGICLGPWLHSFRVTLPEHLNLKAANTLEPWVACRELQMPYPGEPPLVGVAAWRYPQNTCPAL